MPGELRTRELIDGVFIVTHTVDDHHDGCRADNFLRDRYAHFSRNKLQGWIDEGRIVMDGKRLKASTTLRPGDALKVLTQQTEEPPVTIKFGILFEDEHVLVVDKPGNLPVHPAGKFLFNTLLMQLRAQRGRPYHLIHRLDRETSGVVLLAKDPITAASLVRQFRERTTEKRYSAIVIGHPPEDKFTVDADIGSANSFIRLKMQAYPKGTGKLEALTHFTVLKRADNGLALVDCELKTGRQHQIRVHLSYAGFPVIGDKLYGDDDNIFLDHINRRPMSEEVRLKLAIERHGLHSRSLKFFHERANRWLEIESPLPDDMKGLLS